MPKMNEMNTFARIKEQLSASEVLTHILGPSRHHTWRCPFHEDKTPSLSARGPAIRCFGCGWAGDLFRFIEDHHNVSRADALRIAADLAGVTLPQCTRQREKADQPRLPSLQQRLSQVYQESRKLLEGILAITRRCAADASRRAWSARDSEAVWDVVEIGAVLDRHVEILRMQVTNER